MFNDLDENEEQKTTTGDQENNKKRERKDYVSKGKVADDK